MNKKLILIILSISFLLPCPVLASITDLPIINTEIKNIYIQDELNNNGNAVYDFTTQLHQFTNKVLFLVSSRNEIVGKDFQEKQTKAFRNAELKIVPDCGHNLMWSKPAETLLFIRDYLNNLN